MARRPRTITRPLPVVVSLVGSKGGTTKSASAAAILGVFAERGYLAVGLDLDPQGTLSKRHNVARVDEPLTAPPVRVQYLMPADEAGTVMEIETAGEVHLYRGGRSWEGEDLEAVQHQLRRVLQPVNGRVPDFVVIDTAPALGVLTQAAMVAASIVVIPTEATTEGIEGIQDVVAVHRKLLLPTPLRILWTKLDGRIAHVNKWARGVVGSDPMTKDLILNSTVPYTGAAVGSAMYRLPVTIGRPDDDASVGYRKAVTEIGQTLGLSIRQRRPRAVIGGAASTETA